MTTHFNAQRELEGRSCTMPYTNNLLEHKGAWDGFCVSFASALFEQQIFAGQKRRFVLRTNTRRIALKGGCNG
jgi:hypothetical protein